MRHDSTVRLFFRTGKADRQVCWFQMTGDDLYFGSSKRESVDLPSVAFSGVSVNLEIPDEVAHVASGGLKASYHESGQFHVKVAGVMKSAPESWPDKASLLAPLRVATLITRLPVNHEEYKRSLTRGNASAVVIDLKEHEAHLRHYFEFFLSPPGQFAIPPTLLQTRNRVVDTPLCSSLSDRFVLAVRHQVLSQSMQIHAWHPEAEIWLYSQPLPSAGGADA